MNKRTSLFFVAGLVVVLFVASLVVLLDNGFLSKPKEPESEPETAGFLWQRDIDNFATGLAAANGRVYTIDIGGDITCYDARTGEFVWVGSIGGYWGEGVVASSNLVYGGKSPVQVGAVKASNGDFQWVVGMFHDSAWSKRAPSNITVLEGRLFVTGDSFAVYDATTGELLWENVNNQFRTDANVTNPSWLTAWPFEGNRVFGIGRVIRVGNFAYRLDPDTGDVLWSRPIDTLMSGLPVVYGNQVVMRNDSEEKTTVFSLDENSGDVLWSYNVDARVFQPTAYNGLLVFGASDDSFYALHLSDGTLAWKSMVDSQNITALVNFDNPLEGLPIQIDTINQRAVGGFAVTTQTLINETRVEDDYWGMLCSLDIETGNVSWIKYFTGDGDISREGNSFGFSQTENNIYLTSINDFRIFDKRTGDLIEQNHFEHYALSPIAKDNRVFVAADLWLTAYE